MGYFLVSSLLLSVSMAFYFNYEKKKFKKRPLRTYESKREFDYVLDTNPAWLLSIIFGSLLWPFLHFLILPAFFVGLGIWIFKFVTKKLENRQK